MSNRITIREDVIQKMSGMLGIRIRKIRKLRNLTQYLLADMVSVDVSTINKIERNKANPSLKLLERIATALGVPITELLEDEVESER